MAQQASNEDLAAFLAAVDGATPLSRPDRVSFEGPKPSPRPLQRERDGLAKRQREVDTMIQEANWTHDLTT